MGPRGFRSARVSPFTLELNLTYISTFRHFSPSRVPRLSLKCGFMATQGCRSSRRKVSARTVPAVGPMFLQYMDACGCVWPHMAAYGVIWAHMAAYFRIWPHIMAAQGCRSSRRKVSARTVPAAGPMVLPYMDACGCIWPHRPHVNA